MKRYFAKNKNENNIKNDAFSSLLVSLAVMSVYDKDKMSYMSNTTSDYISNNLDILTKSDLKTTIDDDLIKFFTCDNVREDKDIKNERFLTLSKRDGNRKIIKLINSSEIKQRFVIRRAKTGSNIIEDDYPRFKIAQFPGRPIRSADDERQFEVEIMQDLGDLLNVKPSMDRQILSRIGNQSSNIIPYIGDNIWNTIIGPNKVLKVVGAIGSVMGNMSSLIRNMGSGSLSTDEKIDIDTVRGAFVPDPNVVEPEQIEYQKRNDKNNAIKMMRSIFNIILRNAGVLTDNPSKLFERLTIANQKLVELENVLNDEGDYNDFVYNIVSVLTKFFIQHLSKIEIDNKINIGKKKTGSKHDTMLKKFQEFDKTIEKMINSSKTKYPEFRGKTNADKRMLYIVKELEDHENMINDIITSNNLTDSVNNDNIREHAITLFKTILDDYKKQKNVNIVENAIVIPDDALDKIYTFFKVSPKSGLNDLMLKINEYIASLKKIETSPKKYGIKTGVLNVGVLTKSIEKNKEFRAVIDIIEKLAGYVDNVDYSLEPRTLIKIQPEIGKQLIALYGGISTLKTKISKISSTQGSNIKELEDLNAELKNEVNKANLNLDQFKLESEYKIKELNEQIKTSVSRSEYSKLDNSLKNATSMHLLDKLESVKVLDNLKTEKEKSDKKFANILARLKTTNLKLKELNSNVTKEGRKYELEKAKYLADIEKLNNKATLEGETIIRLQNEIKTSKSASKIVIDKLREELKTSQEKTESLERDIIAIKANIKDLSDRNEQNETHLKSSITILEEERKKLKLSISNLESRIKKLVSESDTKLKQAEDNAEEKVKTIKEELTIQTQLVVKKTDQILDLNKKNDELSQNNVTLESKLADADKTKQDMSEKVVLISSEKDILLLNDKLAKIELESKKQQIQLLSDDLEHNKAFLSEKNVELLNSKNQIESLELESGVFEGKIGEYEMLIQTLEENLAEEIEEYSKLTITAKEMDREIKTISESFKVLELDLRRQIEDQSKALEKEKGMVKQLMLSSGASGMALAKSEAILKSKISEHEELSNSLAESEDERKYLKEDIDTLSKTINQNKKSIDTAKTKLSEKTKLLGECNTKIGRLTHDIKSKEKECKQLSVKIIKVESELISTRQELLSYITKYQKLETAYEEISKLHKKAESKLQEYEKKITVLQREQKESVQKSEIEKRDNDIIIDKLKEEYENLVIQFKKNEEALELLEINKLTDKIGSMNIDPDKKNNTIYTLDFEKIQSDFQNEIKSLKIQLIQERENNETDKAIIDDLKIKNKLMADQNVEHMEAIAKLKIKVNIINQLLNNTFRASSIDYKDTTTPSVETTIQKPTFDNVIIPLLLEDIREKLKDNLKDPESSIYRAFLKLVTNISDYPSSTLDGMVRIIGELAENIKTHESSAHQKRSLEESVKPPTSVNFKGKCSGNTNNIKQELDIETPNKYQSSLSVSSDYDNEDTDSGWDTSSDDYDI